jgi:hypothetical protein
VANKKSCRSCSNLKVLDKTSCDGCRVPLQKGFKDGIHNHDWTWNADYSKIEEAFLLCQPCYVYRLLSDKDMIDHLKKDAKRYNQLVAKYPNIKNLF